ncbi:flavin reductase family protein [Virgibacillus kekensis]|uniref:Flavin reductase family protein n=1 Tax=Virgibacillus kekensis TaxID=202261 RepID=A0ABV9DHH6_9BACI
MDTRFFRNAIGKFATGISVVSTEYNGEVMGMTVNAFMSVSLNPRLIAISIDEKARMYDKLKETGKFGISILKDSQKDLSMIFAKQMDKDREVQFVELDGNPVLEDSIVTLSCYVKETAKAGDHMIFIAEVTDIEMKDGEPVLYYGGQYRNLQ